MSLSGMLFVAALETMNSVRLDTGLKPSMVVQSGFVSQSNLGSLLTLITSKPTVQLSNYPLQVTCNPIMSSVRLDFGSASEAKQAFDQWSAVKDLVMMISHEEQSCNGVLAAAVYAKFMRLKNKSVKVVAVPAFHRDFVDSYNLTVQNLDSKWESPPFVYGLNYDQVKQQAKIESIPLAQPSFGSVVCDECYAFGQVKLRLSLSGTPKSIDSYSIDVDGDLKGNLGIRATVNKLSLDLLKTQLFQYNFAGVSVPGIFSVGPEFVLNAQIKLLTKSPIQVNPGFTINYPFSFGIYSNDGIFKAPKTRSQANPTVQVRPFQVPQNINLGLEAHLIPEIDLGITVFSFGFSLGFSLDNALGIEADRNCKSGFDLELYGQAVIGAQVDAGTFHKFWPLYDTGRQDIACVFCQQCQ